MPGAWYLLLAWQLMLLVAAPVALYATGFFERRELRAARRAVREALTRRAPTGGAAGGEQT